MTNYLPSVNVVAAYKTATGMMERLDTAEYERLQMLPYEVLGTLAWRANHSDGSSIPILTEKGEINQGIVELVLDTLGLSFDAAELFLTVWKEDLKHAACDGRIHGAWGCLTKIDGKLSIVLSDVQDEGIKPTGYPRATLTRTTPYPGT